LAGNVPAIIKTAHFYNPFYKATREPGRVLPGRARCRATCRSSSLRCGKRVQWPNPLSPFLRTCTKGRHSSLRSRHNPLFVAHATPARIYTPDMPPVISPSLSREFSPAGRAGSNARVPNQGLSETAAVELVSGFAPAAEGAADACPPRHCYLSTHIRAVICRVVTYLRPR